MRYINLLGTRFGMLVATSYVGADAKGQAVWECVCDCGGKKTAKAANLKRGRTNSCGCLAQKQRIFAAQSQKHPLSRTEKPKEYKAWEGMNRRCYSPKHPSYINYGARGIKVCDRWGESFANFYSDMGDAPNGTSLERIDNNANYSPENCKWATRAEQANNRRSNRMLTFNGETLNVSQWSKKLGWHKSIIAGRIYCGWPVERTLTQIPHHRNHTP